MSEVDSPRQSTRLSSAGKNRPRRVWLRRVLYAGAIMLGLLLVALIGLRLYFNDARFKSQIEQMIGSRLGATCRIGSLDTSLLGLSAELRDLSLETTGEASLSQFLNVDRASVDLKLLGSLFSLGVRADLELEGLRLDIRRMRAPEELRRRGEGEYTTNVHEVIAGVARMPWKDWLEEVNWQFYAGKITATRCEVRLSDAAGQLRPCVFKDISYDIERGGTGLGADFAFVLETPNAAEGVFAFQLRTEIVAPTAAGGRLSFIENLTVGGHLRSLDAPYILRYYGLGDISGYGWLPGAPLDGDFRLSAPLMSKAVLEMELVSSRLVDLYVDAQPLPGAVSATLRAGGGVDFSREWSEYHDLSLKLQLGTTGNPAAGSWLDLSFLLNGSQADSLTLGIESRLELEGFGNNAVGRLLHFSDVGRGAIVSRGSFISKSGQPLRFELGADAKSVVMRTREGEIEAPLAMRARGELQTPPEGGLPTAGELVVSAQTAGLEVKTLKPFRFSLANERDNHGTLTLSVRTGALWDRLALPLQEIGIGRVAEVVTGEVTLREDQALVWLLQSVPDGEDAAAGAAGADALPVQLSGEARIAPDGAFSIINRLRQDEGRGVDFLLSGSGTYRQSRLEATFEEQLSARVDYLYALAQRLQGLLGGLELPAQELTGTLRQAARVNLISQGNDYSLALAANTLADKMSLQIGDVSWRERKAQAELVFTMQRQAGAQSARVRRLNIDSAAGKLTMQTGDIDIDALRADLPSALRSLPEFSVEADLGRIFFRRVNMLTGNLLPTYLRNGQRLVVNAGSAGTGAPLKVDSFSLVSPDLSLTLSAFTLKPLELAAALQDGNYPEALQAFSPLSASLACGAGFWRGLPLPEGFLLDGELRASLSCNPQAGRLHLPQISYKAGSLEGSLIGALEMSADIHNLPELLRAQSLSVVLRCLPGGLRVDVAEISVPVLQRFIGTEHQALLRALRGDSLRLNGLALLPLAEQGAFTLAAGATLDMAWFSQDASWPLLELRGEVALPQGSPLRVHLEDGRMAVSGVLDLTGAGVRFAALNPYIYAKAARQSCQLSFSMLLAEDGGVSVPGVLLAGGPLPVKLTDFYFKKEQGGEFALRLKEGTLGAPFNLTLSDIIIDKPGNTVSAAIATSGIDFTRLSSALQLTQGVSVSGSLGASSLRIKERYDTIFGGRGAALGVLGRDNLISIGALNLDISGGAGSERANFGLSVGGGRAEAQGGEIVLDRIVLKKPAGYSVDNPLTIERLSVKPDMRTLFSDSPLIERIVAHKLEATIEVALRETNIGALQKNLERIFPADAPVAVAPGEVQPRKPFIREFVIQNGSVKLAPKLLRGVAVVPVPLPDNMVLTNIGGDSPGGALRTVFEFMLQAVGNASTGLLKDVAGLGLNITRGIGSNITRGLGQTLLAPFGGQREGGSE